MNDEELRRIRKSQQELIATVGNLEKAVELTREELLSKMNSGFDDLETLIENILGEFRQVNKDVQELKRKS